MSVFPTRGLKPFYDELKTWLFTSHNADGTLRDDVLADMPISTATSLALADKADQADLDTHTANVANPHGVTKTQVGLGNVTNTADADKPVSAPQQTALDLKANQSSLNTTNTNVTTNTTAITGLTPTNNDEFVTKVGGVITSVKPGRIDARVRGITTAASDNSTLLATLATESGTNGSELWIPEGTYRTGQVDIPSNARVRGSGTLKHKATSPSGNLLRIPNGSISNVLIEGLTLDGNGTNGLVDMAYYPGGATNVTIRGCTFQNTNATYNSDYGITANGADGLFIERCVFDCEAPIRIFNVHRLKIRDNLFKRAGTLNAMDLQNYGTFVSQGLEITGNVLRECYRMGIELVRQSGTAGFEAPLIANNDIEIADTHSSAAFGISINWSDGARFLGNSVAYRGSGTYPGYAYEVVSSPGTLVADNTALNVGWGVSINKSPNSIVDRNRIYHPTNGIILEAATPNATDCTITRNIIKDAKLIGIYVGKHATGLNGGDVVADNVISREVAWTGDGSISFFGIQTVQDDIPSRYARNRIEQGQTAPTAGFAFYGFVANNALGTHAKSQFTDNLFIDRKTGGAMMNTLTAMSGGAALADTITTGNVITNATGTKSDANTWPP